MTDDELEILAKHGNTPAIQNWAKAMIELRQNLSDLNAWADRWVEPSTIDKHSVQRAMSVAGITGKAIMFLNGE